VIAVIGSSALTHDGAVIATRTRSAHPPTVKLLSPRPGTTLGSAGNVAIRWKAADADGDPLDVVVSFSTDGGRTLRTLTMGGFAGRTTVPAAQFGRTSNGRIRIAVNDGFDEVVALPTGGQRRRRQGDLRGEAHAEVSSWGRAPPQSCRRRRCPTIRPSSRRRAPSASARRRREM
jgi:hypothetical protein